LASSLTVNNIDGGYGSVRVLHDLSITVDFGETVVLLGSNGNGKSTLLKCITGLIKPDRGEIILNVDGEKTDLVGKTPEEVVTAGISMVPEGRRLFPALTVEENLYLGAYRKFARKKISENLDFVYEIFPRLKERRNQLAGSMSGGEQQMVAVARGIMSDPTILLVDEPSVGLAPNLVSHMIGKIRELKEKKNLTVLMAEQNFNQAIKIADRGYVIVHGEIEFTAASADELADNEMIKQYYLGA
jgi:branched-chain amino acid transport system ATP-binding protein